MNTQHLIACGLAWLGFSSDAFAQATDSTNSLLPTSSRVTLHGSASAESAPRDHPSRVAPILLGTLAAAGVGIGAGFGGFYLAYSITPDWRQRRWGLGFGLIGGFSAVGAALGMMGVDAIFGFRGQGWSPFAGAGIAFGMVMLSGLIEFESNGQRPIFNTVFVAAVAAPLFTVLANELWVLLRPDNRARSARPVALLPMAIMQSGGASLAVGGSW
jgi:hypothetical protein